MNQNDTNKHGPVLYKSENQIKRILGINAWRNLLGDKIVRFTAMMPDTDNSVLMAIIDQLPQFWHMSIEVLDFLETRVGTRNNPDLQKQFWIIRKVIATELEMDRYRPEDRESHVQTIFECLDDGIGLSDQDWAYLTALQKNTSGNTRQILIAILCYIGGHLNMTGVV